MAGKPRGRLIPCRQCGQDFYVPKCRDVGGKRPAKYCSTVCHKIAFQGSADLIEAFWSKVAKTDGCWLYTGFRKWDGYGWLCRKVNGKPRWLTAHRYAWTITHGEPPAGMHILHKCDNPPCCNPDHLRLGTHQENMADAKAKGRTNAGMPGRRKPVLWPDRVRPVRKEIA
jgi:hypothetical protein